MTLKSALLLSSFLGLMACGQNPGTSNLNANEGQNLSVDGLNNSLVGVIDETGKPVVGAQVMIGTAANQPFADNITVTDSQGKFKAPAGWTTEQPVTIQVANFVRATYLKQLPTGQNFAVRKKVASSEIELSGLTSGFQIKDYDGWVDFGVVVPAVSKSNFFNFDVTSFISPYNDTISVIGRSVKVPSNLSLPKQSESYFISITLDKPKYRTIFKTAGSKTVFALKGKFPLSEVVDEVRGGKDFSKLTNYFNFSGGSLRELNLTKKTTLNIPLNDMKFTKKVGIRAPQMSSDDVVFGVSLSPTKSLFFPADIKGLQAGKTTSMNQVDGNSQLLSVLKKKDELKPGTPNFDRLSASFLPMTNGMTPTFITLLDSPRVTSPLKVSIGNATKPAGVTEAAAYYVLSTVKQVDVSGTLMDVLDNQWEVYGPVWTRNLEVPEWPNDKLPSGNLRWEVTLTAVPNENAIKGKDLGPKWLEAASHASRSSADF
jgi:hypothetical protein